MGKTRNTVSNIQYLLSPSKLGEEILIEKKRNINEQYITKKFLRKCQFIKNLRVETLP